MSGCRRYKQCVVCHKLLKNSTICEECVEKAKNYAICSGCDKFEKYDGDYSVYSCRLIQKGYAYTQSEYSLIHFLVNRGIPVECEYKTEHVVANCASVFQ